MPFLLTHYTVHRQGSGQVQHNIIDDTQSGYDYNTRV